MEFGNLLQELLNVWWLVAAIIGLVYQWWTVKQQLNRLEKDHDDIKRGLQNNWEAIDTFSKVVTDNVNTIMRDHASHEVGQARIESKLEELVRRK